MKIFLFYLIFLFLTFHLPVHSQEDIRVLNSEKEDSVPSIADLPPSTRQTLANLKYLRKLPNFDSKSPLAFIAKPSPVIIYAHITEKEQQALETKNRYNQLVRLIRDRTVSDKELFLIFFKEFYKKTDLDQMHKLFNDKSLAKVLMKVTRPYDSVYKSQKIVKDSKDDKFKVRFRYLGNDIYQLNLKKAYKNSRLNFKNSRLEMKFKIYDYYLSQCVESLNLKLPYTEEKLKVKNSILDAKLAPFLKDLLKRQFGIRDEGLQGFGRYFR